MTESGLRTKLYPEKPYVANRSCELIINANGHPQSGDDVALFIDWENFKISLAAGNRAPNVTALKEEVAHHGRVVVAKAYADWVTRSPELKGASQFINDPPALYAAGIEPVYVPTRLPLGSPTSLTARTTRVKNSVDVKMTADCIECAHSYPNIGTYVLVSGDSDFIHVINSLRAIGKRAIIIGVSWSTSRRLADQVDGLILYDTDVDPEIHHEPAPEPAPAETVRATRSGGRQQQSQQSQQSQQLSEVMRVIEEIVRAERQAGRTPLLTSLKQRIMRRVPGFDEKKLGFSGFKKLMLRTAQEGNIKLVTVGLVDWVIMADEPTPPEALGEETRSSSSSGAIESVAADEEAVPVAEATPSEEPAETTDDSADAGPVVAEATAEVEAEAVAEASEGEAVEGEEFELTPLTPELEQALAETSARAELPDGPGDGLDGHRIRHLIIMADSLEHREGVSHVAFNFLIGEICSNLREGLEAEHPEIAHCWGEGVFTRTYVTRLVRGLKGDGVFVQGWHNDRDEETGRVRRRRTFNLNREHSLATAAVNSMWGEATAAEQLPDDDAEETDVKGQLPDSPEQEADAPVNSLADAAPEGDAAIAEDGDDARDNPGDDGDGSPENDKEDEPRSAVNRVMRLFRG